MDSCVAYPTQLPDLVALLAWRFGFSCFGVQFCRGVYYYAIITMMYQFDVIVERDSAGYFVASVPALPGCHTQAKSLDDLMMRIREAIELYLEVQGEAPEPLDFIGIQRISVAA